MKLCIDQKTTKALVELIYWYDREFRLAQVYYDEQGRHVPPDPSEPLKEFMEAVAKIPRRVLMATTTKNPVNPFLRPKPQDGEDLVDPAPYKHLDVEQPLIGDRKLSKTQRPFRNFLVVGMKADGAMVILDETDHEASAQELAVKAKGVGLTEQSRLSEMGVYVQTAVFERVSGESYTGRYQDKYLGDESYK